MTAPGRPVSVTAAIERHFADLEDPRVDRTKKHALHEVLTIAILAVLCGAEGWDQIEAFADAREAWLRTFLSLPHGTPSDDTFRRVFAALDPKAFARCFTAWMQTLVTSLAGKHVALDGKTLRGSFDHATAKSPLHLVHAWAAQNDLLLGQLATEAKSNEITAIPQLLELLELRGAITTIDAMGCQTAIAAKIVERGGEYVLALKDNHPALREEVATRFDRETGKAESRAIEHADKGHGRLEVRRVESIAADGFVDQERWRGLKSFVRVERTRTLGAKTSTETAYYLSSLAPAQIEQLADAIRAHWGVENKLHWTLDVSLHEDACRIRDKNGAENFALLRRIALNLLRQDKPSRSGAPTKRLRAALDPDYLLRVLQNAVVTDDPKSKAVR